MVFDKLLKSKPVILTKEYLLITLFTIPYAIVVNHILVPHAVVGGGLTGFCEIIYFASHRVIPIWASSATINVLLLIAAYFAIGKRYVFRTLYGVFWLTFWLKVIPVLDVPIITDPFMAVVLGGIFNGTALGLVFINNGSTGGTDIVAMIVNKYQHLPMGRVLLICDIVAISCGYFLPEVRSLEKVLFGLCYTFISSTAVDWIMNRMRQSVQFFIFSKKYKQIAEAIIRDVHRGVTYLDAQGAYSEQPYKVITTIARQHESAKIFRIVRDIDPDAFVSQSQVRGVFGEGFDRLRDTR
ncbi:MAG: YitT family protein [Paludibacteraceae bacterium]|nr:YitT family protein [Paludibacteraceae bacterium]